MKSVWGLQCTARIRAWWIGKVLAGRIESFIIKLDYPESKFFLSKLIIGLVLLLLCVYWGIFYLIWPVRQACDGGFCRCWWIRDCRGFGEGANPTETTADTQGLIPQDRAATTSPLGAPCLWTRLNRESTDCVPLRLQFHLFKYLWSSRRGKILMESKRKYICARLQLCDFFQ